MQHILTWIKNNKIEFAVILTILIVAAFFRFYRLSEYMTFLGDEGRDALEIKKILTTGDLPFIGPPTSIGNMYLGPLYYYMMAVAMAIFWLNPVAAAGMVAIIGVLSVGLIYYLGREWFGKRLAFLPAALFALSPVTITYSKSSWNPNPAPFFALLSFLTFYLAHKTKNFRYFILTGVFLAFLIQMHYLALILLPIMGILWLNELRIFIVNKKETPKYFLSSTILAIVAFLLLMSPLVLFDLKHDFTNYKAVTKFFSNRETTVNLNPFNTVERIVPIYKDNLIGRYMVGENSILAITLSIVLLLPCFYTGYLLIRRKPISWQLLALSLWLLFSLLGLALYKQTIYDHYIGFLAPAPYLLLLVLLSMLKKNWQIPVGLGILLILGFVNLQKNPLQYPPNKQLQRTQNVAKFIIQEAAGKPFNFALIAEHNYDAAYQFYLDIYGHKPPTLPDGKTEQLLVVCEDKICNPVGHPKQEIAAFGWTKIESEKMVEGVKVFKLIPNPNQPVNQ